MKDIYIVSDVHGRPDALREALFGAGLFDNHGLKDPRAYIVQIGDLANCVAKSFEGDVECLDMVGREIDLMLIGNHEIPYFDRHNTFSGFHYYEEISIKLWELNDMGVLWPCYQFQNTLITHAGISVEQLSPDDTSAWSVANRLERIWHENRFDHPLLSDCGLARHGKAKVGGILWCDFDVEITTTEKFPQIVGHTPGILRQKDNALCIDTGARNGGKPTVLKLEA